MLEIDLFARLKLKFATNSTPSAIIVENYFKPTEMSIMVNEIRCVSPTSVTHQNWQVLLNLVIERISCLEFSFALERDKPILLGRQTRPVLFSVVSWSDESRAPKVTRRAF